MNQPAFLVPRYRGTNPVEPEYIGYFAGWNYQVKSVLHSTEPANYRGSLTSDLIERMYNSAFHKYRSVLATKALIIIGLVIIILGVIFLLQSKSSLGPSMSFMYSNPEWTVNGYIIIAMGFIVIGVGVITRQY